MYTYNEEVSGLSRDSLLTDSRPSGSRMFNAHLYGDNKPYFISNSNFTRVEGYDELARIEQDLKNLDTSTNFIHFIVERGHPHFNSIVNLAGPQDKVSQISSPQ